MQEGGRAGEEGHVKGEWAAGEGGKVLAHKCRAEAGPEVLCPEEEKAEGVGEDPDGGVFPIPRASRQEQEPICGRQTRNLHIRMRWNGRSRQGIPGGRGA